MIHLLRYSRIFLKWLPLILVGFILLIFFTVQVDKYHNKRQHEKTLKTLSSEWRPIFNKGIQKYNDNDFSSALELFSKSATVSEGRNDSIYSISLLWKARCFYEVNELDSTENYAIHAKEISRYNNYLILKEACYLLADLYIENKHKIEEYEDLLLYDSRQLNLDSVTLINTILELIDLYTQEKDFYKISLLLDNVRDMLGWNYRHFIKSSPNLAYQSFFFLINLADSTQINDIINSTKDLESRVYNKDMLTKYYCLLGDFFEKYNEYTYSENYYKKAVELSPSLNDSILILKSYLGLSSIYIKIKNYEEASDLLNEVTSISSQLNDYSYTFQYHTLYSQLYLEKGKVDSAFSHLKEARKLMNEIKNNELLIEFYEASANFFQKKGNYKKASDDLMKLYTLRSEIDSENENTLKRNLLHSLRNQKTKKEEIQLFKSIFNSRSSDKEITTFLIILLSLIILLPTLISLSILIYERYINSKIKIEQYEILEEKSKIEKQELKNRNEMLSSENKKLEEVKKEVNSPLYQSKGKIYIKGFNMINFDEILYFKRDVSGVDLFLKNNRKAFDYNSLSKFEEVLPFPLFIRCDQSHIVNIRQIKSVQEDKGKLYMENGHEINISKRKKQQTLHVLRNQTNFL